MKLIIPVQDFARDHVSVYAFHCPACDALHSFSVESGKWTFNGDEASPTFSPSLRVSWTQGREFTPMVCHLFVKKGKIEYCSDSTHAMAGKTVDMVDVDSLWS